MNSRIPGHWLASLFVLVLASVACTLVDAQNFPALAGRVVDQAQLLSPAQESSLAAQLEEHEAITSNQIVVVTVPDLEGYAIADYANRLGRAWQIGTAENNNGVLLLVAPNEREVRIEVGYGLEGALTDSLSSVIIQREILPRFRANDYPGGISNGIGSIIMAIDGEYAAPAGGAGTGRRDPVSGTLGNFLPLIFIAMVAVPEILRRTGMRKAANGAFPAGFTGLFVTLSSGNLFIGIAAAIAIFLLLYFKFSDSGTARRGRRGGYIGTGGGFGGGGLGGGGFGGGGGSFGGGGASGSW